MIRFPCGCSYNAQRFVEGVEVCKVHFEKAKGMPLGEIVAAMRDGSWLAMV